MSTISEGDPEENDPLSYLMHKKEVMSKPQIRFSSFNNEIRP